MDCGNLQTDGLSSQSSFACGSLGRPAGRVARLEFEASPTEVPRAPLAILNTYRSFWERCMDRRARKSTFFLDPFRMRPGRRAGQGGSGLVPVVE